MTVTAFAAPERDAAVARLLAAVESSLPLADPARHQRWLAQGLSLCEGRPPVPTDPLRTLHHFACTGGTLISKCIAALPNVQLLSEVDPLSTYLAPGAADFSPTDIVTLLRRSTRGASAELIAELFGEQVRGLHRAAARQGLRLVLRDHAHSHFCHGSAVEPRPGLRQLMPAGVPLRSLVTVRHPLDSFASLARNGWLHFEPRTLDAYCRRYITFLDHHAGVPVLRYEDFVAAPQRTMQRLCEVLDLRYDAQFTELYHAFRVSGDSGRSGETIAARPSHPEAVALEAGAGRSEAFRELVGRLGYGQRAGTTTSP